MLARLVEARDITERDRLYIFYCPEIASKAKPGQFVEVKPDQGEAFFLRRPISICDCDGQDNIHLLVRNAGKGTGAMTQIPMGTTVDIIGPLGNGFYFNFEGENCLLVGGGIGLAPLVWLARELKARNKKVKCFFSPKRDARLLNILSNVSEEDIAIARNRNEISEFLNDLIPDADMVFACGPDGMLKMTAEAALKCGISCQLSMERYMACGIGICLGCAIAIRSDVGLTYKKVCKDGPVFWAEEVEFDEKP